MPEPFELTVGEAARAIRDGELTPVALVESLLARVDALEPSLLAWVYLDRESLLAEAEAKTAEVRSGGPLGPLHGVPIGLKDIYYTAGIPTTACSKVYADFVPEFDGTSVRLLKEAGAIMMGKTVTTEFACMDPSPTFNPWDAACTPGGSSSGSAVSVAARMCPAALGSQTVGSVLRPASYNGVVGFKPSFGRISRHGVVPVSWTLDTVGWMCRSVEDVALMLQAMAGYDPADMVSRSEPATNYVGALNANAPPRIGVLRDFFYDNADTETTSHTDEVLRRLAEAGAEVEEVPMPESINTAIEDQQIIMAVEAGAFHQPMHERQAEDYQPRLRGLIERGLSTPSAEYSRAMERRQRFVTDMRRLANRPGVLLTPTTPQPAQPDRTNTGNTMFQGPWTSCGLPTITLPSGLAESGLPLGVQLAGPYLGEGDLLAAAAWCERVLDVHLSPPL